MPERAGLVFIIAALAAVISSCGERPATTAQVDYAGESIWSAPWPDERLRTAEGTIDVDGFPNPRRIRIVDQLKSVLRTADGFGTSSTIFFPLSRPIDPSTLTSVHESITPLATVFVMDVEAASPERGQRRPVVARFDVESGPFGVPNVLALLPLQGMPLRPNRLHVAVVTTRVLDADGEALETAPATRLLLEGERPDGLSDAAFAAHLEAIDALREAGVDDSEIAATAVFRTWDPTLDLVRARDQVAAAPLPLPGAFEAREEFTDYCVFHTTLSMPVFQEGTPPFSLEGGGWVRDANGMLLEQVRETSNVWITVPRQTMPDAGFPTVLFVRTGGGGDRPLVDRGPHATAGAAAEPGTGPAMHFARAGFLGISVDGPLGGLRNLADWDEQFQIFNINNPTALRDTVRQSALELILLAYVLPTIDFDGSSCAGVVAAGGRVRLDISQLTMMGHSMGATIGPLAVAVEPRYRALILSGAGGSWIENVVYKQSPLEVRPIAETLLHYDGYPITEHDPVLALLQWGGEPADPQVYARTIIEEPPSGGPRHVLMFQGILDTYIPPPVANALSLALGVDLGGERLDETLPEYEPLGTFLDLAGRDQVPLPDSGNRGTATAFVVQHLEDGIEDGHEVAYQRSEPQLQYRCFLDTLRVGIPQVPASSQTSCP